METIESTSIKLVQFVRELYGKSASELIPLHAPHFGGNEKKYLNDTIDSTFVSSVGAFVNESEKLIAEFTGAKFAIATGNGTLALHASLLVAGVKSGDEVITQALTFVATGNAIKYCGANPIFVDVDLDTAVMSPTSLLDFLESHCYLDQQGNCINKISGKKISACVPMHTFGLVGRIEEIAAICEKYNIVLVEDAAESMGSYCKGIHTGRFGKLGTLSFNGNKTITCGGGGAILTDDETLAKKAKHITTTAKIPHQWDFFHDELGYNYRLPNLNAALLVAQMEQLPNFLQSKRKIASNYQGFFMENNINFIKERTDTISNYWLNNLIVKDREERDFILNYTNSNNVMTRPVWILLNKLPVFANDFVFSSENSEWLEDRIINIPSSVII